MATHSSFLARKIPWTEEPGKLQPMELQRVGHDKKATKPKYAVTGYVGILPRSVPQSSYTKLKIQIRKHERGKKMKQAVFCAKAKT